MSFNVESQTKKPGDVLKSEDWNGLIEEIKRLGDENNSLKSDKLNCQGSVQLLGSLTITEALNNSSNSSAAPLLEVKGKLKLAEGVAISKFSTDNLGDSSEVIPTEKAIKAYVDSKIQGLSVDSSQSAGSLQSKINSLELSLNNKANLNGSLEQRFSVQDLTIGGSTKLSNGSFPFILERYSSGDNPCIDTEYPVSDWIAIIAGFAFKHNDRIEYVTKSGTISDDRNSSPKPIGGLAIYMKPDGNNWQVRGDAIEVNDEWTVFVLFISKNLATSFQKTTQDYSAVID